MKEVINKWQQILEKDSGKDVVYGRKVLIELLTDVKTAHEKEVKKYLKK